MRVPVPFTGSVRIVNTSGVRKGFSIQNVSTVDVYFSDDQRQLDSVDATGLPTAGHLLPAATPSQPPTVFPFFNGQIFARAQSVGAQLEVMIFETDPKC